MEASALRHQAAISGFSGRSPLLRLQSDEKLIALTRKGNASAFETLVQRYQPRLLAFCRHMLASKEDAEDVLQEVFAASYNALLGDNRPVNARPWLYRIARNRCLNHLRKPKAAGQDSMDIFERDNGTTTAETVHQREEFRDIVADVQGLPETQRTALLLREIDALSYDQIAEAMDTTIPSVKSLLVRARVALAESAESRLLTCEEVRLELGHVAEGLAKSTPPVRRHLKSCERCRTFKQELRNSTKALAAMFPVGPLLMLQKFGVFKLGFGAGAGAGSAAAGAGAGGAGIAASGAAGAAGAASAGGMVTAGIGAIASKAAAGMAAAVIVTAGAVEVNHAARPDRGGSPVVAAAAAPRSAPARPAPITVPKPAAPATAEAAKLGADATNKPVERKAADKAPTQTPQAKLPAEPATPTTTPKKPSIPTIQEGESTATLPPSPSQPIDQQPAESAPTTDGTLGTPQTPPTAATPTQPATPTTPTQPPANTTPTPAPQGTSQTSQTHPAPLTLP